MLRQIGILGQSASMPATSGLSDVRRVGIPHLTDLSDTIDALVRADAWPDELRATEDLAARYTAMLQLLADAIDSREQFNPGSSTRVLEHASRFAVAMGLDADGRVAFERGALLRDIGKLRVPNDVLLKHSLLTYDEWRLLQAHTVFGSDLASSIPGLGFIAPVSRHHHENFDGTGYPEGLEGAHIPLLARAVKIVDVFCAMTSPRVYRMTIATRDEAFEHLTAEREKFYDPELVDVFIGKNVADDVPVDRMAHAVKVEPR